MKTVFVGIALSGVSLFLHGCGGGGGGGSSTTTTTTSAAPTATTTTTLPPRTKPMTSKEAAEYLNQLYLGFESNESTQGGDVGVTISMAANNSGFFGNIYCSKFFNPAFNSYGKCFKGQADCRMSTSVLSHGWMITENKALASFGNRRVGYVFNQTMVESKWTRCSYIWDGASFNLYNRGCGDGAPSGKCGDDENNAFNNKCGSDKHTCTANDDEVKRAVCTVAGGARAVPADHAGHAQCVFPGPAFDYRGQDDYKPNKDYTREMAKQRLKYNDGSDNEGPNLEKNNEVVLDEELLIKDIWENPITAIPAVLYTKSNNAAGINRMYAAKVRDDLCNIFGCGQNGGGTIPLVMVDDTEYQKGGPFFEDQASENLNIAV